MKITTEFYGIFYKSDDKWSKTPLDGRLMTRSEIIKWSQLGDGLDNPEMFTFKEHQQAYLKDVRKWLHKPVKFLRQCWLEE